MFVSAAPIHCACQSEFCSTPIVQVAGWLHAETFPSPSQTRTFQNTGCHEASVAPAQAIWIVSSETTLPLDHKSPWSRARFFADEAARIS